MDKKAVEKVCTQVYRRFPFVKNQRPQVKKQSEEHYLLVFSGSGEAVDGKLIQHTIRVVASSDGRIIKSSMSR
jgi:hypothetical protein